MKLTTIKAKTLPEAWYLCIREVMDTGYEYVIDKGSFAGQRRKEFDLVIIQIEYPRSRPLVPDVPLGIPPPVNRVSSIPNDFSEERGRGLYLWRGPRTPDS